MSHHHTLPHPLRTLCACIALVAASASAVAGPELINSTPYTIDFGAASVSGSGRLLRAASVPIVINGTPVYFNLDFELQYQASTGSFSANMVNAAAASGAAQAAVSSNTNFVAGNYTEISTGCIYSLGAPTFGNQGVRSYAAYRTSNPRNAIVTNSQCVDSHSWSTEAPANNNYIVGSVSANVLPTLRTDVAYGRSANSGGLLGYQVIANGNGIVMGYVSNNTGTLTGGGFTLVRN